MRRIFGKPRCKCPRCVTSRRIRFLAAFGCCVAAAAGCYVLGHRPQASAPPTLNPQQALEQEPTLDLNASLGSKAQPLLVAATLQREQDDINAHQSPPKEGIPAHSPQRMENLTVPDEVRNPSKNHTSGANKNGADAVKAYQSGPYGLLSQWLTESCRTVQRKPEETSLNGNELLLQNQDNAAADPESKAPAVATTLGTDSKSNASKSDAPEEDTDRAPMVVQSKAPANPPEPPSGKTSDVPSPSFVGPSIADPSFAGPDVTATVDISPTPAKEEAVVAAAADIREKRNPEDVAMAKASGPDKPSVSQPKEIDSATRATPDEALVHGNGPGAPAQQNEIKESEPKPGGTSTGLVASLGNNTSSEIPAQELRKPRGFITIKSEPEASQNQETEDRPPKPQDHPLRTQNHPLTVEDYSSKTLGHSQKPQDQPPNVRDDLSNAQDHPSKQPDLSGDLRRFASSFVQADQTGNIADQHRFFADSVHFYREGDLSWAGVAAATRRYHQERQNRRYGAEGTATVKGPVNGGFYVVDQPVSWSRSDGSRVTRGRSVLRLRVVPTGRDGWKITSIEEIGQ